MTVGELRRRKQEMAEWEKKVAQLKSDRKKVSVK